MMRTATISASISCGCDNLSRALSADELKQRTKQHPCCALQPWVHTSPVVATICHGIESRGTQTTHLKAAMLCSTTLSVLISWRKIKRRMQFRWLHSTAAPCSQKKMLESWHPHVQTIRPYTSSQRYVQGPSTSTHTHASAPPWLPRGGHLRPQTGVF